MQDTTTQGGSPPFILDMRTASTWMTNAPICQRRSTHKTANDLSPACGRSIWLGRNGACANSTLTMKPSPLLHRRGLGDDTLCYGSPSVSSSQSSIRDLPVRPVTEGGRSWHRHHHADVVSGRVSGRC